MISKMGGGRSSRRASDLVGIEFGTTGTKVVRVKEGKSGLVLVGAELLPAVDLGSVKKIDLPRNLVTNYCSLVYSGDNAVVRMINTPLPAGDETLSEEKLRELFNVGPESRVSAQLISKGAGGGDSSLLAAVVPEDDVQQILGKFSDGKPSPVSLEVAGLTYISAFLHSYGDQCKDGAVCLIDGGESVSNFAFLNKGKVALVGKMGFGAAHLREKLCEELGVDEELASSILSDRSINISSPMANILESFVRQVSISKDFIERHLSCRVSRVYVSGGMSLYPDWSEEVGQKLRAVVSPWNPLEKISIESGSVSADLEPQMTRFSSVIGAVVGELDRE